MSDPSISPQELASRLAAKLCHDLMGPASGLVSAMELVEDAAVADLHTDALALAGSSARSLVAALTFARAAFGAGGGDMSADDLKRLVEGVFSGPRARLTWSVAAPALSAAGGRVLLNLAQIALGGAALGGVVEVSGRRTGGGQAIEVKASGERVQLRPEVLAGLGGASWGDGLPGRWVQAYYTHALTAAAGGLLRVSAAVSELHLVAELPD